MGILKEQLVQHHKGIGIIGEWFWPISGSGVLSSFIQKYVETAVPFFLLFSPSILPSNSHLEAHRIDNGKFQGTTSYRTHRIAGL